MKIDDKNKNNLTDSELLYVLDKLISEIELFSVSVVLEEHSFLHISNQLDEFNDVLETVKSSIKHRARPAVVGEIVVKNKKTTEKKKSRPVVIGEWKWECQPTKKPINISSAYT